MKHLYRHPELLFSSQTIKKSSSAPFSGHHSCLSPGIAQLSSFLFHYPLSRDFVMFRPSAWCEDFTSSKDGITSTSTLNEAVYRLWESVFSTVIVMPRYTYLSDSVFENFIASIIFLWANNFNKLNLLLFLPAQKR